MSIDEIRKICQIKGNKEHWYTRIVTRRISIYITYLLIRTSITPNQVTLLAIIFVLISSTLFTFGNNIYTIVGAIVLQLYVLFDCVDGEIARYRIFTGMKTKNNMGKFMELIEHLITIPIILMTISYGAYKKYGIIWILLGFSGVYFFMFLHNILFWADANFSSFKNIQKSYENKYISLLYRLVKNEKLNEIILNIFATSTLPLTTIILAIINKIHLILILYGMILPLGVMILTFIIYLNLREP